MKKSVRLACLCASLAACAHRSQWDAAMKPLSIEPFCIPRAMHPTLRAAPGAPEARKEQAFLNYYEAFLDAKEQTRYLDCLKKRWRVPWLHADYRRGRSWLRISQEAVAESAPLAGPDQRIADVEESFTKQDGGRTLRRVVISLSDGTRKIVEETFGGKP